MKRGYEFILLYLPAMRDRIIGNSGFMGKDKCLSDSSVFLGLN